MAEPVRGCGIQPHKQYVVTEDTPTYSPQDTDCKPIETMDEKRELTPAEQKACQSFDVAKPTEHILKKGMVVQDLVDFTQIETIQGDTYQWVEVCDPSAPAQPRGADWRNSTLVPTRYLEFIRGTPAK